MLNNDLKHSNFLTKSLIESYEEILSSFKNLLEPEFQPHLQVNNQKKEFVTKS